MVTTTTACDANVLTFKYLSESMGVPLFVIDVPYNDSESAREYVKSQLLSLRDFISEHTGRPFDEAALSSCLEKTAKTLDYYDGFLSELVTKFYPNMLTLEMYKMLMLHILMGSDESLEFFRMQYDEIRTMDVKAPKNRVLWCHVIPYYVQCLRDTFDLKEDIQLLAADMNFDFMERPDPSDPYGYMAKRLLRSSLNGDFSRRAGAFTDMADRLGANAAILFAHWGCKETAGGVFALRNRLVERGIRTLVLDGDACDRRNHTEQQMRTRLEAFTEMLEGEV
jgi:benzoyl-CoA reductase/2-hydroxyglutaryl-CoA dehydratase subunit BcrC/BadD/HgdB